MTRKLFIGVGVALAGTVLASTAVAGPGRRGFDGMRGMRDLAPTSVERLAEVLDLSDDQLTELRAIEDRAVKASIEVKGKIEFARHELRRLMRAEQPDRAAIHDKVDELALYQAELHKLELDARLDGRAVLTAEQIEQLVATGRERLGRRAHERRERRERWRERRGDSPAFQEPSKDEEF